MFFFCLMTMDWDRPKPQRLWRPKKPEEHRSTLVLPWGTWRKKDRSTMVHLSHRKIDPWRSPLTIHPSRWAALARGPRAEERVVPWWRKTLRRMDSCYYWGSLELGKNYKKLCVVFFLEVFFKRMNLLNIEVFDRLRWSVFLWLCDKVSFAWEGFPLSQCV